MLFAALTVQVSHALHVSEARGWFPPGRSITIPSLGSGATALTPAMPKSSDFLLRGLVEHTSKGLVGFPRGKQPMSFATLFGPHERSLVSPGIDHTCPGNVHGAVAP